jgi:hypothetical protein
MSPGIETFLEGKGAQARALFDGFERLIAACGPYEISPAKTRVSFSARARFATVWRVHDRGMTISFALPRALRSPRFAKVEEVAPGWVGHFMRVESPGELDDELAAWLQRSYDEMGMRER